MFTLFTVLLKIAKAANSEFSSKARFLTSWTFLMCFFKPGNSFLHFSQMNTLSFLLHVLLKISKAANLEFSSKDRFLTSWTLLMCFFNLPTPGTSFLHFSQMNAWVSCFMFCWRFQRPQTWNFRNFFLKLGSLHHWLFLCAFFNLPMPGNSFLHFYQLKKVFIFMIFSSIYLCTLGPVINVCYLLHEWEGDML